MRILRERLGERTEVLEVSQAALMWTQRLNLVATVGAGMAHAGNLEGEKAMFELGERGAGLRPTLQCLGGKDIGLSPLQGGAEWRMEADPLQVEEAPGNLVANGRDAMAG